MSDDYSTTAIIIALVSVLFTGLTFVLNWFQTKSQRLASESQFISDIQKDLDSRHGTLTPMKTQKECIEYVWGTLNTLDRACFFESTGRLQDDIIKYFINYLEIGWGYYNWMIKVAGYSDKQLSESFPYFVKTCKKHSIKEYDNTSILDNFKSLPYG